MMDKPEFLSFLYTVRDRLKELDLNRNSSEDFFDEIPEELRAILRSRGFKSKVSEAKSVQNLEELPEELQELIRSSNFPIESIRVLKVDVDEAEDPDKIFDAVQETFRKVNQANKLEVQAKRRENCDCKACQLRRQLRTVLQDKLVEEKDLTPAKEPVEIPEFLKNFLDSISNGPSAAETPSDKVLLQADEEELPTSEASLSGGKVDYYLAKVDHPQRLEQAPYQAECEDLIQALNLTFDEANIFKEIWRTANARQGNGKPGNSTLRAAQKIHHYAKRILNQAERSSK